MSESMSTGWVVAQTKPQRELYAAENLARQEYEHYLPRVLVYHTDRAYAVPLFPSYIFVHIKDRWLSLLSTYGITRLIMSGPTPAIIPQHEIDKLRAREEQGFVNLNKIERFRPGQVVHIKKGLYAGMEAIYDAPSPRERAQVLMDYLGRKTKVLIGEEMLEVRN